MIPKEKIRRVLEAIKAQYDLSPKGGYSTHSRMGYSRRYPEGEIRVATNKLMAAGGVDYYELEKILAKLQEEGLIDKFSNVPDYV